MRRYVRLIEDRSIQLPKNKKKPIIIGIIVALIVSVGVVAYVKRDALLLAIGAETQATNAGPVYTEYKPSKKDMTEIAKQKNERDAKAKEKQQADGRKNDQSVLGASQDRPYQTRKPSSYEGSTSPARSSSSGSSYTYTAPSVRSTTCNEELKRTYTQSYDAKVESLNTDWERKVAQFEKEAETSGQSYLDTQIKRHKPTYDAYLANEKMFYEGRIRGINCL